MDVPKYKLVRSNMVMVCDTPRSEACATLVMLRDKNKTHNSDWWGHPTIRSLHDGTMVLSVPSNIHNIQLMKECGAKPDRTDSKTMNRLMFFANSKKKFETDFPLMSFQQKGAEWLVRGDLRRVLAYTMGLGKTITSMSLIMSDPKRYLPAVILAPAHVKLNWADEWKKWNGDPDDVIVLFGRTPKPEQLENKKMIVLNHHILNGWLDTLISFSPRTLIIDEAHGFVNSTTKTYRLANKLAIACSRRVLMLTATPLVNRLGDLWGLTSLMSPDILGTKKVFEDTFMPEEKAKKKMFASRWRGGFQKSGWRQVAMARLPKAIMDKRIEELGSVLRKYIILRKTKEDVYDELPNITETHLRIDIPTTTKEGKEFWNIEAQCEMDIAEAKEDVLSSEKMLPAFSKARSNSANAKIDDVVAWLKTFLSDSGETEKVVVVGWSVAPLEKIHKIFKKESLIINGKINTKEKKKREHRFDTDPKKRILFGNFKSIGTGINLVAASTMLFFEFPLTAVDFEQVKGRIDRISQKSNNLSYYYLMIRGSLEERMVWKIIRQKQKVTRALGL